MTNDKNLTQFSSAAQAQAVGNKDMLPGVGVTHWKVKKNHVTYQKHDGHTLSLYLNGGETSYRADKAACKGAPGTLCLMPQGHESEWQINGDIEFVHLYFADELLKQAAAATFSSDVRCVELTDLLYQQDDTLRQLLVEYISLCGNKTAHSPLFAEQTINKLLHHLLNNHNGFQLKKCRIAGGLSPYRMRLINEAIHEQLEKKLSIEMLASLINLSPFHFARVFKLSFGETPASYITRIRVNTIKSLLKKSRSLAEISVLAGFSHQSHMTRNFKNLTGMTPSVFQQSL